MHSTHTHIAHIQNIHNFFIYFSHTWSHLIYSYNLYALYCNKFHFITFIQLEMKFGDVNTVMNVINRKRERTESEREEKSKKKTSTITITTQYEL